MGTDNVWSLSSHSNASNTMELAYFSEQQPIQATAVTNKSAVSAKPMPGAVSVTVPLAARSVIPRTISPDIARTAVEEVTSAVSVFIGNGGVKFKLALVQAVVIEIYSCLHITVFLTPLAGPFLALIMQLFARLEAQICAAIPQINPPSFAGHEAIVKALAQANTAATAGASYTTIDDLVDLLGDLMLLRSWMASELPRTVSTMIIGDAILEREALVSLQGAINKSLSVQSAKTLSLMNGVWTRLCSMICIDCKSSLQAVKGVAGKYRLTNKPPPDSASPFVSTILNPLRYF